MYCLVKGSASDTLHCPRQCRRESLIEKGLQNSDLEVGNGGHLERGWAFKQLGRMFDALTELDLR